MKSIRISDKNYAALDRLRSTPKGKVSFDQAITYLVGFAEKVEKAH